MSLIKKEKLAIFLLLATFGMSNSAAYSEGLHPSHSVGLPQLKIVSPTETDTIVPGETVKVVVQADPGINTAMVVTPKQFEPLKDTPEPMVYNLEVPANIHEGLYPIKAISEVGGQLVESPQVKMNIKWPANPVLINATPNPLQFKALGRNMQLNVIGAFSDGKNFNVTSSSRIIYTSENPHVASVNSTGMVSSLSEGIANIKIQYDNAARVVLVVSPQGAPENIIIEVLVSIKQFKKDKEGNYTTEIVLDNHSAIPLAAVRIDKITLNKKPAIAMPEPKKNFGLKEKWIIPVTFPKDASDEERVDIMHVEGNYYVIPEIYNEPRKIEATGQVQLPL